MCYNKLQQNFTYHDWWSVAVVALEKPHVMKKDQRWELSGEDWTAKLRYLFDQHVLSHSKITQSTHAIGWFDHVNNFTDNRFLWLRTDVLYSYVLSLTHCPIAVDLKDFPCHLQTVCIKMIFHRNGRLNLGSMRFSYSNNMSCRCIYKTEHENNSLHKHVTITQKVRH